MPSNNLVNVFVTVRKEKIFTGTFTEFNDDLSHLSGEEFWNAMVEPLVAHAKQEFIKDYEKAKE